MSEFSFEEAIAFYRNKVLKTTLGWTDLWQEEHSHAFMVAGANTTSLVEDFFNAIQKAKWAKDGGGYEGFRTSFDEIVKKHGWAHNGTPGWRSRIIYDTNITQAYNAGRYQQMVELKAFRPYWRYRHTSTEHPRLQHLAWDGIILPADDPWFNTHYPQNGWRCRCRVESLTEREAEGHWKAKGKTGPDTAPPIVWEKRWVGKRSATPRLVDTPVGIDPGFAYNPGRAWKKPPEGQPSIAQYRADRTAQAGKHDNNLANFVGQRPSLFKHEPVQVTELTGNEFGENLSKKELAMAADLKLRTLQKTDGLVNADTGWRFSINKSSRKKMGGNPDLSAVDSKAVAGIGQLVISAILVENHPDIEHGNEFISMIHRFYTAVSIDGVLYQVKLTAKCFIPESGKDRVLHALSAIEIENALLGTLPSSTDKSVLQTAQPTTGRTVTITELLKNATMQDGSEFKP